MAAPAPASAIPDAGPSPRRALVLATLAYVAGMTAHATFIYYLAPVALREAGVEGRDAWVFAGTAVATMLAVLPAGRLADRHPRRHVLRAGLALLALEFVALLLPISFPGILAGTLLSGTGLALLFVSFTSYVADLLAARERTLAYGNTAGLAVLASAAGPFLAAVVLRAAPDRATGLLANGALFLVLTLAGLALALRLPSARGAHAPAAPGRASARVVLPFAALYLLMGAGYGMTTPYFAVFFLDHLRWLPEDWGFLLAVGTVASAAGSIVAGRLGRRMASPGRVLFGGQALTLASAALFVWPLPGILAAAAFAVRNFFTNTVGPIVNAALMERAAPAARAQSQAWASLAWNFGWTLGASAGAVLLARHGGAVFSMGHLLALAGVAVGVALMSRRA